MANRLIELDDAGTSLWLDYIRRNLLTSGDLQRLVDNDALRGMTSNPTIFEKAISGSTDYDLQIHDLAGMGKTPLEIFQTIATDDIREACDALRSVYDQLDGKDGYVSIEVSPDAAGDTERTLTQARELWALVDRPNVMIKVPGTTAGLPAIEQLISQGINVNITLLFAVANYVEVTERYLRGLERRQADGHPIDHIGSVASFFVSRVDSAVDKQLQAKIDASQDEASTTRLKSLLGKAAIANAKIAYEQFERIFTGSRWQKLADAGAMVQRPLWASTSTKNPAYRDVMYVEELIGHDTVNTMPQETMTAFKDHGEVAPTLTQDIAGAHKVVADLSSVGIDIDAVTAQLQVDGVKSFVASFEELLDSIDSQRTAIGIDHSESESLGGYAAAVEHELQKLQAELFTQGLWSKDTSLWSTDPTERQQIAGALGWLNIVASMSQHATDLENFAAEIRTDGFTDAVVLGMGGSSLCPDVLTHTFPTGHGAPKLSILDTTDPAFVRHLTDSLDLKRTLFIVSSKSGTTAEPNAFFHYFWGVVQAAGVHSPGHQFVVITDPGTPLEAEAYANGLRRIFAGDPEIGGRYSALSNFGMVPAAVMGIRVTELLSRATTMAHATQPSVRPAENPGVRLGTILGVLAREGCNKLTLVVDDAIGTFGGWVEQLIAESTGKSGTGILPVDREALGDPALYGNDRIFVRLGLRGHADATTAAALKALSAAGHPVVQLELNDTYDLGGEFFRWEIATATAGHILGINAFNQPNVQESKDNTNRLLAEYQQSGSLTIPATVLTDDGITVSGPRLNASHARDYLDQFLAANVKPGAYVAIMAYVQPEDDNWQKLNDLRISIRDRFRVATTFGYGPRFLHSTGQLHKGGPAEGVFIQVVSEETHDVSITDEPFTFRTLIAAQSIGDFQALEKHGRPVVRFDLGADVTGGLARLAELLSAATTAR
jgi:transaldolase/glucose-6-phosphate isomerase